jgi:hypothetical protein
VTRLELTGAAPSAIHGDVGLRTASVSTGGGSGLGWLAWVAIAAAALALLVAALRLRRRTG